MRDNEEEKKDQKKEGGNSAPASTQPATATTASTPADATSDEPDEGEAAINKAYQESVQTMRAAADRRFADIDSIADYYRQIMEDNKGESEEERERREKLERTRRIIGGIGDVSRALGNLYWTTQYAPNAYDGKSSLTEANLAREERAKKEREKRAAQYMNALKQMQALQGQKDTVNYNTNKFLGDLAYKYEKDKADRAALKAYREALLQNQSNRTEETGRHNQAMESVAQTNARTRQAEAATRAANADGKSGQLTNWNLYNGETVGVNHANMVALGTVNQAIKDAGGKPAEGHYKAKGEKVAPSADEIKTAAEAFLNGPYSEEKKNKVRSAIRVAAGQGAGAQQTQHGDKRQKIKTKTQL